MGHDAQLLYRGLLRMFWRKKPAYVEWKLTGDTAAGCGAVIYLSAAPMIAVHEIPEDHRTYEDVAEAVEHWVSSVPQQYRLNEEFERFKELARELDGYDERGDGEGPFGRFNR
jgi:hypothetical protein